MARSLRLLLALGLGALTPLAAHAAAPLKLGLVMQVYAGGINVMTVESATEIADGRYAMRATALTLGMANFLTRFQLDTKSEGKVGDDGVVPQRFESQSNGRLGRRMTVTQWDDAGLAQVVVQEPSIKSDDRVPVTEAQRRNTVDPLLAGVLRALTTLTSEPCTGTTRVFDGRRRYDLGFKPAGEEPLGSNRYSAFAGMAIKCDVKYDLIAGQKKEPNDAEKAADNPISLWVTRDVDKRLWLPVRLEIDNPFGNIIIHLVRADIDGETKLKMAPN